MLSILTSRATTRDGGQPVTDPDSRSRPDAASWVAAHVSHAAVVSCDQKTCQALAADGFPANRLLVLSPRSPYPLASDVVMVTAKVTHQFGSSLGTQWAPAALARFGSGASLVEVRIIAPKGAAAYQVAASADLALRKAAANALLTSEQVAISPTARELLAAGQVDSRLIVVLTAMAARKHVNIVAFQAVGPGADAGIPLRVADLAGTDPADKLSGQAYLKWIADLLATQPADLRPASVRAVKLAGRSVLRIEFAAPSPLGLLGPSARSG